VADRDRASGDQYRHHAGRAVTLSASSRAGLPDGGRFVALDSLRGIAALGVVFYHLKSVSPLSANPVAANGQLFVDFFFVLSGFVIAAAYGEKLARGFSALRFMLLRLGRIYPLHIAMVAAYLALEIAAWLFGDMGLRPQGAFQGLHSPDRLLRSVLLIQAWWEDSRSFYNMVSWSISVELFLYLVAALCFRFLRGAWLVLLVASVLALLLLAKGWTAPPLTYDMLRGIGGFGLGAACQRLHAANPMRLSAARASIAETGLVMFLLLLFAIKPADAGWFAIMTPAFAATVFVFAHDAGALSRLLQRRLPVLLGTVSYSIYMVHAMIVSRATDLLLLLQRATGWRLVQVDLLGGLRDKIIVAPEPIATLLVLAIVALVIGVSLLSWRYIEAPAREWSRRRAARMGAARAEAAAPTI
jgi:peptidoglycan/LPS O-acetylase OafA/YrhL